MMQKCVGYDAKIMLFCFILETWEGRRMAMERKVIVYNNQTGVAARIETPCTAESIHVTVADSWEKLLAEMAAGGASLVQVDIML